MTDIFLAIALGFSMAYTFTGGLVHEILGIILLIGLMVHLIRRFRYYTGAIRSLFNHKKKNSGFALSFTVNLLLIPATVVMLATSVLISNELFSFRDLDVL